MQVSSDSSNTTTSVLSVDATLSSRQSYSAEGTGTPFATTNVIPSLISDSSFLDTRFTGCNPVYNMPNFHMPSMSFNNAHVSTTQNWLSPLTSTSQNWMFPPTSNGSEFTLCFRTENISVCNGCKNKFQCHPMTCAFDMKNGGLINLQHQVCKNPACIICKWPSFHPSHLVIPPALLPRLLEHKTIISSLFGTIM